MEFKQFEYILMIDKEKSFSKAAKKLFISQPSLSQYVARLENQLGVSLFNRSTTPLTLTDQGEIFVATAASILKQLDDMKKNFDDFSNLKSGKLNIGLTPSKANAPLPEVLSVFREKYPGITVSITEGPSLALEDMLIKGMVDICMMNLPIANPNIDYDEINKEKIYIAAPPDFSLPNENKEDGFNKIRFKDIAKMPFILLRPEQRLRQFSEQVFAKAGVKPNIFLETSSIETSLRLSAAGMGFSFVPEHYLTSLNLETKPKYYSIIDNSFDWAWTLVIAYRRTAYKPNAVNAFAQVAKEVVSQ